MMSHSVKFYPHLEMLHFDTIIAMPPGVLLVIGYGSLQLVLILDLLRVKGNLMQYYLI